MRKKITIIAFCLLFVTPSIVSAQPAGNNEIASQEVEMMDLFYEMSSLPTRTPRAVDEVPAIMTVITAEEIRKMGARDMRDVLARIPGMQIGISAVGYSQITFHGMPSHGAEKIKFMVDGHDVDITLTGGSALIFADLSVDYIQKVEVLHGPGSALYGSDAMLGVINIVTRRKLPFDTASVTTRFGSNDSQRYNIEYGRTLGAVRIWSNVNYYNTNGYDVDIERDGLSASPVNSKVSNAPGQTNEWVERSDFSFGAELGDFLLQGQYLKHRDGGFFNPGFSLTDETTIGRDYFWSDLAWDKSFLDDQLSLRTKLIYNRYNHDYDVMLQPPGFTAPGPRIYSDGQLSVSEGVVEDFGADLQVDVSFLHDHLVTFGSEVKKTRLHDVTHHANYDPAPLPGMEDVSDTYNWMAEADRTSYAFYIQDQWQVNDAFGATLGGRYDHYDDFGSALSPSIGLNWRFNQQFLFKLLYGESFRAPSFRELYKLAAGTPLLGNADLDAEDVKTWQAEIKWQPDYDTTVTLSSYVSKFHNSIDTEEGSSLKTFVNGSDSRSRGIDLQGRYHLPPPWLDMTLIGSLSYIDSEDDDGDETAGVASWLGSAGFDWNIDEHYVFNMTCRYVGSVPLEADDSRDDVDDYILTDLALSVHDVFSDFSGLDIGLSIHNLFDVHYAYPELTGKLLNNFERPGITADIWLKYQF